MVFDHSGRQTYQAQCRVSKDSDPPTPLRSSFRLHYENATDVRPRWTSQQSEDTSDLIDSVYYHGSTQTPTHMSVTYRKGGSSGVEARTRIDSLLWDGHVGRGQTDHQDHWILSRP